MKELICQAIQERKVLIFSYGDQTRMVDPFTLGYHKDTSNLVLSAWWVGGYSESKQYPHWRLYKVDEMQNIRIDVADASSHQNGYNPNDSRMSSILCTV